MRFQFHPRAAWQALMASLAVLPFALLAQTTPAAADPTWRDANDAVGQYPRGHADVLKWENNNLPPPTAAPELPPDSLALRTPGAAIRQAWLAHPDLVSPLQRLGPANVDLIASGEWSKLDPRLLRNVDDIDEVLRVAVQGKTAWLEAVAARQVLQHHREALEATDAAAELGQRMVRVGNWSPLQQTQTQLARLSAQANLRRAQYAAAQAQARLLKTLRLTGVHASVALADKLPDVPARAMAPDEWQPRITQVQAQLSRTGRMHNQANLALASEAYQASHALARGARDEVLKIREFIADETVLHYNGMLKSVWDLLDEVRTRSQATVDAIAAQRDYWIAETDLQWVLQGGTPGNFVVLGSGGAGEASAAAGH